MTQNQRTISVREYIAELRENGEITDHPHILGNLTLLPITIIDRQERFCIAEDARPLPYGMFSTVFVYYPTNLDHAELFSRSRTRYGGPQTYYPGSVAVLQFTNWKDRLSFDYLQYCFRQGSPSELTRSLVSKYMNAEYHLLRAMAQSKKVSKTGVVDFNKTHRKTDQLIATLERVIAENETAFSSGTRIENCFYSDFEDK
ncbi:hypothetical protein HY496_00255 [Candidatus Woesearchaeota archaeon]|nr:hypothetical protein [Candidatus Woesearchaeota archaeon]